MHSPTDFKIHRAQPAVVGFRHGAARHDMPLAAMLRLKAVVLIFMVCAVNTALLSHYIGTVIELKNNQLDSMLIAEGRINDENISLRAQRAKLLSRPEIEQRAALELGLTLKEPRSIRSTF